MSSIAERDGLNMAHETSGCDPANVVHKPRLLSVNCASYIFGELKDYIPDNEMSHVRDDPYHPQTQGLQYRKTVA